jgi:poly(3-hydroxybutyrate) depolymerase
LPEIKAIAPVSGQLAAKGTPHRQEPILPPPDHEVAMYEMHGTADPLVLYRGRQGKLTQRGVQDMSALRTAQIMAQSNGHHRRADRTERTAKTIVRTWGKDPRGMVKLVSLRGGGHSVPGTDSNKLVGRRVPVLNKLLDKKLFKTVSDVNGPREIVDFFKEVSVAYPSR